MKSDEELFEQCRLRDSGAWEALIQRHQTRMLNLAYQFCGNKEEARDLAQDVFVRLYHSMEQYQPGRSFKTWLNSLARNLCIDHYRKRKKDRRLVDKPVDEFYDLPSHEAPTDHKLEKRERREILMRALDTLGPASRDAIVMKDFQNMSLEEMSRMLGLPIGTVKSRISRARVDLGRAIVKLEGFKSWTGAAHDL